MIIDAKMNKDKLMFYVNDQFKKEFHELGIVTSVMIINASHDLSNIRYIEQKKKFLDNIGIRCYVKHFDEKYTTDEIYEYIKNHQMDFTGVMIQTPIHNHLNYETLISAVDYNRDVDGLHPMNQGLMYARSGKALLPCTAFGAIKLMYANNIKLKKQNVVIIGRGKLVADPLTKILEDHDCTVTKIHTKTNADFAIKLIKNADIIISCAGKDLSHMINPVVVGDNLKALIGVGFRYENGKQLQDFDIHADWNDNVKITNNVNATGLATICALVDNILQIKMK